MRVPHGDIHPMPRRPVGRRGIPRDSHAKLHLVMYACGARVGELVRRPLCETEAQGEDPLQRSLEGRLVQSSVAIGRLYGFHGFLTE